jgi:hypothetical protein
MYNKNFWKPKDRQFFCKIVYFFTFLAFISTFFHLFRIYEAFQTITKINISCDSHSFSRNWNTQIHKVIKCIATMFAMLAFYFIDKLSCKEICYYRIVSFNVIFPPIITLLIYWKFIKIHFFIGWFLCYFIEFFM